MMLHSVSTSLGVTIASLRWSEANVSAFASTFF